MTRTTKQKQEKGRKKIGKKERKSQEDRLTLNSFFHASNSWICTVPSWMASQDTALGSTHINIPNKASKRQRAGLAEQYGIRLVSRGTSVWNWIHFEHCLVTLSLTINETLKWLSSLPISMQESFWWWQCSDRYNSLTLPHLHKPFPPSLISRTVSVDVKHHVYFVTTWMTPALRWAAMRAILMFH